MTRRSAAATASARARSSGAITDEGPDHARRRARPHQGVGLLRLLHRPGRAAADADARRRLQSRRRAADVHLHRPRPRRRAPADRGQGPEDHPRGDAGAGLEDLLRLRQVPAGAELLSALRLARRIRRRLPVALHQRARPRQHPEGRHLFGRAAHVGRHDHAERAARHRRRRRQVRHPDGEGHRRPAHRHARRQEGGPARGLGRSQRGRHGLRPRLRQGPAHGEDLRRHRLVPLRHAGFHRPRHQAREVHVGLVDAGQGQAGRLRLPAQLRRGDLQGRRRRSASTAATRSTSPAPPASTSRAPRFSATVDDRGRGARGDRGARRSSIASRAATSSASTNGPSASASMPSASRWSTTSPTARRSTTASSTRRSSPRSIPGPSARQRGVDRNEFAPMAELEAAHDRAGSTSAP